MFGRITLFAILIVLLLCGCGSKSQSSPSSSPEVTTVATTLVATVIPINAPGTFSFYDNGTELGTSSPDSSNGEGSVSFALTTGVHTLSVNFVSSDPGFGNSSDSIAYTVSSQANLNEIKSAPIHPRLLIRINMPMVIRR